MGNNILKHPSDAVIPQLIADESDDWGSAEASRSIFVTPGVKHAQTEHVSINTVTKMASTIWGKMFRKLRDDPQGQDPHNNVHTWLRSISIT